MQLRAIVCIVFFVIAYIALIPGLMSTLFTAKASMFGFTIVDMQKSTIGTIRLLYGEGRYTPAAIIFIFSVIMPFVKLAALIFHCVSTRRGAPPAEQHASLISGLQAISKWATVDIFAAAMLVAFLRTVQIVEVDLHEGFFCFLAYCIFSVAGALLLELPEKVNASTSQAHQMGGRAVLSASAFSTLLLLYFGVLLEWPCLKFTSSALMINKEMSIYAIILQLWTTHSPAAALTISVLVVILPALDLLIMCALLLGYLPRSSIAARWVRDFSMLDVFALSAFVVALATSGFHNAFQMTLLETGKLLCGFAPFITIRTLGDSMLLSGDQTTKQHCKV